MNERGEGGKEMFSFFHGSLILFFFFCLGRTFPYIFFLASKVLFRKVAVILHYLQVRRGEVLDCSQLYHSVVVSAAQFPHLRRTQTTQLH